MIEIHNISRYKKIVAGTALTTAVLVTAGFAFFTLSGNNASAEGHTTITHSFSDAFNYEDTLKDSSNPNNSDHESWWLKSGGEIAISDGAARTLQGSLSSNDELRRAYALTDPETTDNGFHPQNKVVLLKTQSWENVRQDLEMRIVDNNIYNPDNSNPSNGIWLVSRYVDENNHYSVGLTVSGEAVIKKIVDGDERILASSSTYDGNYNEHLNPNILPESTIGFRSVIENNDDGSVSIDLHRKDENGNWIHIEHATDTDNQLTNEGHVGLKTEFMDAEYYYYSANEFTKTDHNHDTTVTTEDIEEDTDDSDNRRRNSRRNRTRDTTEVDSSHYGPIENSHEEDTNNDASEHDTDNTEPEEVPETETDTTETEDEVTEIEDTQTNTSSSNQLRGANLYVNPDSPARNQINEWSSSRPADAQQLEKIADRPVARWLGNWNSNIEQETADHVNLAASQGQTPVIVAYNITHRDCGSYSAGGAGSSDGYRSWIDGLARGIGNNSAVVILEPDALSGMDCLSSDRQQERVDLLRYAVGTLKAQNNTMVYVDAGHSQWHGASDMASRLSRAGVAYADGFALNTSNYHTTESNISYGEAISENLNGGNTHFVIDTSRNGNGAPTNNEWCNPDGRALGEAPKTSTGHSLIDAFLWVKVPGESDGTCNGGPSAGSWWADYALGLAERANW